MASVGWTAVYLRLPGSLTAAAPPTVRLHGRPTLSSSVVLGTCTPGLLCRGPGTQATQVTRAPSRLPWQGSKAEVGVGGAAAGCSCVPAAVEASSHPLGEASLCGWAQGLVRRLLRAHPPSSCLGMLALGRSSALQMLGEL